MLVQGVPLCPDVRNFYFYFRSVLFLCLNFPKHPFKRRPLLLLLIKTYFLSASSLCASVNYLRCPTQYRSRFIKSSCTRLIILSGMSIVLARRVFIFSRTTLLFTSLADLIAPSSGMLYELKILSSRSCLPKNLRVHFPGFRLVCIF